MRERKYRGMDSNGNMRYGRLSQDKEGSTLYYKDYSQRICWGDCNVPVSNESLGEFIGISDKNGVEIYDGDWCMTDSGQIMQIVFCKCGYYLAFPDGSISTPIWPYIVNNVLEVIGNIFEAPELADSVHNNGINTDFSPHRSQSHR